jgi:hypothetical protein
LENYGEEVAPKYSEKLENFRNEMLAKVDDMENTNDDGDLLQETYHHHENNDTQSYIREIIEEENDEESVNEAEVPTLEIPEKEESAFSPSKGLIQEIITPSKSISSLGSKTGNSLKYFTVLPESPSKSIGFNRKPPALASITELDEEEDQTRLNCKKFKYVTPIDQRKANVSLLEELVLLSRPSAEELSEPLLEHETPAHKFVQEAWGESHSLPSELNEFEAKSHMSAESESEQGLEEIESEQGLEEIPFSQQTTLVELESSQQQQPKQAWN